jgi:membrane fusion protein, multidrug efflux system
VKALLMGILKFVLPVLILMAGAGGLYYLVKTKPQIAQAIPEERVWVISVVEAKKATYQPKLDLYGSIVSGRDVELRSLVKGEIVAVGENFHDGAILEKDALLISIDSFDFIAALDEKKAALNEGMSKLDELEALRQSDVIALKHDREILTLDIRNLKRSETLSKKGNISAKSLDDARMSLSRQQQQVEIREAQLKIQTARIGQQEAAIERARVGVRRAQRNLENTQLRAPFKGYLTEIGAEYGKTIDAKDKVARLIDASRMDARFHLSNQQFGILVGSGQGVLGREVRLSWRTGNTVQEFNGKVSRLGSSISSDTGGIDLLATIENLPVNSTLRPGAFVEVSMPGASHENVIKIPETSLHQDNILYIVKDGRLKPQKVELVFESRGFAYVRSEVEDGAKIATTKFAEMGPGIKVEIR